MVFLSGGVDQAPGRWTGDSGALLHGLVHLAEVLGDRAGSLEVQQIVDPAAASRPVALADQCAHVTVLDRQGHQPARTAGDVPGQRSPEQYRINMLS
ncbi:hypothetical protein ACIQWA_17830 [Kitasatospora sp. NPDC098652]|uniref:hypothetical protein n=1 Tax=Kitasatospora sp. NPDC098652 TaxID=3364095 RepID=UPI0038205D5B